MPDDKAPFQWGSDPILARGAAAPPAKPPSLLARLKAAPVPKAAAFALTMGAGFCLGLAVLAFFVLEFGEAKPAGKGGLGTLSSSIRVRPGARDRLRYLVSRGEVFFGLSKGAPAKAAPGEGAAGSGELDEATQALRGVEEAVAGALDEADDGPGLGPAPAGTRAAGSSSSGPSASLGAGAAAKGPTPSPASAPKFNESTGKVNAKSVRKGRVTRASLATGGDRAGKGSRSDFLRTVPPRGATAGGAGAPPAESRSSGLDFLVGELPPPGRGASGPGASAASAAGEGASGGGGGAGGSGGGGDGGAAQEPIDIEAVSATIEDLIKKSADEAKKSADEEKKAKILAAGGHLPQAHYHYDRSKKAKKKSKDYSDRAQALSATLVPKTPPATEE